MADNRKLDRIEDVLAEIRLKVDDVDRILKSKGDFANLQFIFSLSVAVIALGIALITVPNQITDNITNPVTGSLLKQGPDLGKYLILGGLAFMFLPFILGYFSKNIATIGKITSEIFRWCSIAVGIGLALVMVIFILSGLFPTILTSYWIPVLLVISAPLLIGGLLVGSLSYVIIVLCRKWSQFRIRQARTVLSKVDTLWFRCPYNTCGSREILIDNRVTDVKLESDGIVTCPDCKRKSKITAKPDGRLVILTFGD